MADQATQPASDPIVLDEPAHYLRLDATGLVVGFAKTNVSQPDAVSVDAATFDAACIKVGRCRYADGKLIDVPPTVVAVTPAVVTNYQARAVLIERGLFDRVDAALRSADMTVTANKVALQAWDYANGFSRSSAIVTAMAGALGLSSDDVDQLFVAAAAVP